MKRRNLLGIMAGAAVAWPSIVCAQERRRRIGMLIGIANDADGQARVSAFRTALGELGWTEGRNIQIDLRWTPGTAANAQPIAEALIGTMPDVILASPATMVAALRRHNRTIPVVFVQSGDPVAAGFVQSHRRPGGNATGFVMWEPSISTKYPQLLKDIAPSVRRVAVVYNPDSSGWRGDLAHIEAAARSFSITPIGMVVRTSDDIERVLAAFSEGTGGGLIVPPDNTTLRHRELVVALAAKYRLPAVYTHRGFVSEGGLMSYAADRADSYRRAASYVDRILKGEKPDDMPVQVATKYDLVINLRTAKALGLDVPLTLLARADEVIE
jgi:putative tryptophan/tyrosine transport system substrate-binding protein